MMRLQVVILGHGEMGHALAHLLAPRHTLSIWEMGQMVHGPHSTLDAALAECQVVLFCLPVNPHHEIATMLHPALPAEALCLSIAKGLDESGRTAAQVFTDVFGPAAHFGVLYGPMISEEIRADRPAFADVVLNHERDHARIDTLFRATALHCRPAADLHGHSWSVILKNVYALLFGVADELRLGDNMRGHLMVAALDELSRIVVSLGGDAHTPYGYAGLGDLVTTATSEDSHHHALGRQLARGDLRDIRGEGVHTLQMVEKYQLFDWQRYPLFALARQIVSSPTALPSHVQHYLSSLQTGCDVGA